MAILYPVALGTIVLCDYSLGGFREPEMVKRRPVVVVSPRLPHRDGLCTVVPLSTTAPVQAVSYVVELSVPMPLPSPFDAQTVWAKCDMLATVSFERLDLFRTKRDQSGRRKYLHPRLGVDDLARVRGAILSALGMTS